MMPHSHASDSPPEKVKFQGLYLLSGTQPGGDILGISVCAVRGQSCL